MGPGVWGIWLPDRAVFVNGDPVGLISRRMCEEFDRPFTGELFTRSGGGFFHNHMLGLFQAETVSETPGILVQEFFTDPGRADLPEVLASDPDCREKILRASLNAPIMVEDVLPDRLEKLLPVIRNGRFILSVRCEGDCDPRDVVRRLKGSEVS